MESVEQARTQNQPMYDLPRATELPNLVAVRVLRAQVARGNRRCVALHVSEEPCLARETAVGQRWPRPVARVHKSTVRAQRTEVAAALFVRQRTESFPAQALEHDAHTLALRRRVLLLGTNVKYRWPEKYGGGDASC